MKKGLMGKIVATSVIVVGIGGIFLYHLLLGFDGGNDKADERGIILENVVGNWTEENGAKYYLDLNGNMLTVD